MTVLRHPPDRSHYDVHLRGSDDHAAATMFAEPPFDHVRYAWTNPWGAIDGVDDERYGDHAIRVLLRPDAIVVRFVPRKPFGRDDPTSPFRLSLPEWSFFDLSGQEVDRTVALAERHRIAAVFHIVLARDGDRFVGYREIVLVQEQPIESVAIGGPELVAALTDARAIVTNVDRADAVPRHCDDRFVADHVRARWVEAREPIDDEERWLLTLPFPRDRYRDLPRLSALLAHAARVARRGSALPP